jgi:transposase
MRGEKENQEWMLTTVSPDSVVPQDHPIRKIKALVDQQLADLNRIFDKMYAKGGRPSIPPERLVKATLLMALYSIRSERQLCEQVAYNLLYRYFLDMNLMEQPFVPTVFTKNRDRFLEYELGAKFFQGIVKQARTNGLISEEHFTVDSTLIEAWASMKSFKPKGQDPKSKSSNDNSGSNPDVDFHGEKRNNDTHRSLTDPQSRLLKKGKGKEAKLCYSFHTVTENRRGLIVENRFTKSVGTTESKQAVFAIKRLKRRRFKPKTVGADKGYHNRYFVQKMREEAVIPHVASIDNRQVKGLDQRTLRHQTYQISQRKRKLIEQPYGWLKTVAGFRKTRFRGLEKNQLIANFLASAYNLVRMAKLLPA